MGASAAPYPAPAGEVVIIPGLPDRNSGRIYRLQVGAWSAPDAAGRALQMLQSAGFSAVQEQNGSLYRVLAAGIPAADVYAAAQRLGAMGFRQIWVRE
jgi:cell division septation protein DedD